MERWRFICEDCGKEWPLDEEEQARKHEQKYGHSVYEQKKPDDDDGKKKPRRRRAS